MAGTAPFAKNVSPNGSRTSSLESSEDGSSSRNKKESGVQESSANRISDSIPEVAADLDPHSGRLVGNDKGSIPNNDDDAGSSSSRSSSNLSGATVRPVSAAIGAGSCEGPESSNNLTIAQQVSTAGGQRDSATSEESGSSGSGSTLGSTTEEEIEPNTHGTTSL